MPTSMNMLTEFYSVVVEGPKNRDKNIQCVQGSRKFTKIKKLSVGLHFIKNKIPIIYKLSILNFVLLINV